MSNKKFCLSDSDKKIAGVCGGVAEYFGIDALIVRIIWVVIALCYGVGLILYLALWLLAPHETKS